jgi:hypothetical protein
MDLQERILQVTWTRRHTFEGLRKACGLRHDQIIELALAIKALLDAGQLRFWGNSAEKDRETQYISA